MDTTDIKELDFQPTQELSQEDRVEDLVASTPAGVWGVFFSDDLIRRIDLRAAKAVLGRCQQNIIEGDVQYIRLDGVQIS